MAIEKIDEELCIECGICRNVCPVDVIRNEKGTNKPYIAYQEDCMLCELCVVECPVSAITVTPEKHDPLIVSYK